jgi:hypothetical protein
MKRKWDLPIDLGYKYSDNKSSLIKKFEDKYGLKAVYEFKNEVENLIKICDMGIHWIDCVAIKLLTGKTFVPVTTFSITTNKGQKTVSLNLGPHTTRRDLESNWIEIEKKQKEIWPEIKKRKISKKSLEDTSLFIKDIKLRRPKIERKSRESILKQILELDMYPEEKEEAIQNLQEMIIELKKKELRDSEIVTKLWDLDNSDDFTNISKKEDKRRMDRLRQIRKRRK